MGLFSVYVDIAGRVTETDADDAPIVAAGVAIGPRARAQARGLLAEIPKWRDATPESFERIVSVMGKVGVEALALKVSRGEPAWSEYFREGKRVHRQLSEADGSSISILRPGNVMKAGLLGNVTARLLADCCKTLTSSQILDSKGLVPIQVEIVNDRDLAGDENIAAYQRQWARLVSMQNTFKKLGFGLKVKSIAFSSEQDEPLLLLPDYLAGCFLACEHRGASRPRALEEKAFMRLATALFKVPGVGVNFEDFAEEYPPSVRALAGGQAVAISAESSAHRQARIPLLPGPKG